MQIMTASEGWTYGYGKHDLGWDHLLGGHGIMGTLKEGFWSQIGSLQLILTGSTNLAFFILYSYLHNS